MAEIRISIDGKEHTARGVASEEQIMGVVQGLNLVFTSLIGELRDRELIDLEGFRTRLREFADESDLRPTARAIIDGYVDGFAPGKDGPSLTVIPGGKSDSPTTE
jgi:hypothetical protein